MGVLKIERIGGLAGFGLPGSKLQSSGEQAMSALTIADQAVVDELFRNPARREGAAAERDAFRYRISRIKNGQSETIDVSESAVPAALKACVSDRLT
jgi:hypothetical protein